VPRRWLVAAVLAATWPARARACTLPPPEAHTLNPAEQAVDHTPPVVAGRLQVNIARGRGPARGCGGSASGTSCDELGRITLTVSASDDRSPATAMGFRLALLGGRLPVGLLLPAQAVRARGDGTLLLAWTDGAQDEQEPIDFSLELRAVDAAGNTSAPALIGVHDGDDDGGCALARSPRTPALLLAAPLTLAALALRRRRRWHNAVRISS
jgi:hypothetical protein